MRAVALAVLGAAGVAHADGTSRGFWLGDVDAGSYAEVTLTVAEYRRHEFPDEPWTQLRVVDLAGQLRLTDGLVAFGQVSILDRDDAPSSMAEGLFGPITLGLRQRIGTPVDGLVLAVVPSVTIPRLTFGHASDVAHLLRPDESMYPTHIGTVRAGVEVRWRRGRWWVGGAVAGTVETPNGEDTGFGARATGAAGATLATGVTAVVEGTLSLVRDGPYCQDCEPNGSFSRRFVGAGLRGAWGLVTLAAHLGYGIDGDDYFLLRTPVALDFSLGARW